MTKGKVLFISEDSNLIFVHNSLENGLHKKGVIVRELGGLYLCLFNNVKDIEEVYDELKSEKLVTINHQKICTFEWAISSAKLYFSKSKTEEIPDETLLILNSFKLSYEDFQIISSYTGR